MCYFVLGFYACIKDIRMYDVNVPYICMHAVSVFSKLMRYYCSGGLSEANNLWPWVDILKNL